MIVSTLSENKITVSISKKKRREKMYIDYPGITERWFTFKTCLCRRRLLPVGASLTMSECYQSSQDWRLITTQSLQGASGLDKCTLIDERRQSTQIYEPLETTVDHFDLSYQGCHLAFRQQGQRSRGHYSKEDRQMDSTNLCCPETVSLGSSCKEE